MHSKLKGNIGESAVTLALNRMGCNVFKELGDLSRVDLIAQFENKFYTIQVKGITPKNGIIQLELKKSGPNYKFIYKRSDCDFFAVCNLKNCDVALISTNWLFENHKSGINLRLEPTKNNQKKGITLFSDYTDLLKILRDYTRDT